MHIVYTNEELPDSYSKSLFLAGPTPRTLDVKSWRPEALALLETAGYDGVVFVPEFRLGHEEEYKYPDIPEWELRMLDRADCILFWIPRKVENMPGFTTNVEFGRYAGSGKVVIGAPASAEHMEYLWFMADKFRMPQSHYLDTTISKALEMIGKGALRHGGKRDIPLHIWRLRAFQSWYQAQKNAGNRLDGAKIEWISRVRNKPEAIFAFAIRPNVFIVSENRNKINDPVVFRLDISTVLLYKRETDVMNSKIILIKEFRTAASTQDGFIWELPGGSSPFITDPLEVAKEEVHEEVGLQIEKDRLNYGGSRQLAGTLSTHQAHFYFSEISEDELAYLYKQKGIPHGTDYPDNPTGERAYTEVCTVKEIIDRNLLDWSNIGMILSVLK